MSNVEIVDAMTYFGDLEKLDIVAVEQQIRRQRVENKTVDLGGDQSDDQCRTLEKTARLTVDRRLVGQTKFCASTDHVLIG